LTALITAVITRDSVTNIGASFPPDKNSYTGPIYFEALQAEVVNEIAWWTKIIKNANIKQE
jgi:hypothetical protein